MGDRSISASERQRQLAAKAENDRIEGNVVNEIRKVPIYAAAAADAAVAAHVADPDPHGQYMTAAEVSAALSALLATGVTNGDTTHAPTGDAVYDFVVAQIAALVASSPATLDTLNELATALGNDPNFATTITTALAGKQPLDATLTALAAANWAANALPIGTGADTLAQTAFAANTFPARASTGNLIAKVITDSALAALANWTAYGNFTPTVIGVTTPGVGTYATQTGKYVRFGPLVFFKLFVDVTAHTGTGSMRIDGLPVAAVNDINCPVAVHNANNLALTAGNTLSAAVLANSTQIQLGQTPTGGGAFASVPIDTAFSLALSGFYFV